MIVIQSNTTVYFLPVHQGHCDANTQERVPLHSYKCYKATNNAKEWELATIGHRANGEKEVWTFAGHFGAVQSYQAGLLEYAHRMDGGETPSAVSGKQQTGRSKMKKYKLQAQCNRNKKEFGITCHCKKPRKNFNKKAPCEPTNNK